MKTKIVPVFFSLALGLVALVPSVHAKAYTPAQFKAELTKKIGTKKGTAAAIQAAALLNVALGDKLNKKNIVAYTQSVNAAIKKAVPSNLTGDATNRLVKALTVGYFKGLAFNLNDAKFTAGLKSLLNALPVSQRTQPVSNQIYVTLRTVALSFGVNKGVTYAYYIKVAPGNYPTPVS